MTLLRCFIEFLDGLAIWELSIHPFQEPFFLVHSSIIYSWCDPVGKLTRIFFENFALLFVWNKRRAFIRIFFKRIVRNSCRIYTLLTIHFSTQILDIFPHFHPELFSLMQWLNSKRCRVCWLKKVAPGTVKAGHIRRFPSPWVVRKRAPGEPHPATPSCTTVLNVLGMQMRSYLHSGLTPGRQDGACRVVPTKCKYFNNPGWLFAWRVYCLNWWLGAHRLK